MNTPYNIILSNNINRKKAIEYKKISNEVESGRKSFFSIFDKLKEESLVQQRMKKTFVNPISISSKPFSTITQSGIVERLNRLDRIEGDGWVYQFDLETIGGKEVLNVLDEDRAMQAIHRKNATITEMSVWKVQVKNRKPIPGSRVRVDNFMTAPNLNESVTYITQMLNSNKGSASTTSALSRYAGYGSSEAVWGKGGMIEKFDNLADITDIPTIEKGAAKLFKEIGGSTGYIKGTDAYSNKMRGVLGLFERIADEKNTLISGANIEDFDMPFLEQVMLDALPEEAERVKSVFEKVNKITFDHQLIAEHTIADTIYKDQNSVRERIASQADEMEKNILELQKQKPSPDIKNKIIEAQKKVSELREQVSSIDNNLTLSSMVVGASNRDPSVKLLESHTASPDTEASSKVFETYLPDFFDAKDTVNEANKNSSTSRFLYKTQNAAYIAGEKDIFFSVEDGNINTYNPVLMEKGHTYKVEAFSFGDMSGIDAKTADAFRDKEILKITDLYEGYDRQSYIAYDKNVNKMQEIIDSAYLTRVSDNKTTRGTINKETARAVSDKTRVKHENFFKVNSNEGFNKFDRMFGTYEEFRNISETLNTPITKEAFEDAVKNGVFKNTAGEIIDSPLIETFGQNLKNTHEANFGNISENARNIINFYDDFDANRGTYQRMRTAVSNVLGVDADTISNAGRYGDEKLYRGATSVFSKARTAIENELYASSSDREVLSYITDNNEKISENYSKLLKSYKKDTKSGKTSTKPGKKISESVKERLRRRAFRNVTGEEFTKENEVVRKLSFGDKLPTNSDIGTNTFDILNANGEYTRIDSTNLASVKEKINMTVNRLSDSSKNQKISERLRSGLLNKMSEDLFERNLISKEELDLIKAQNKNKAKVEFLSRGVHRSKLKFDSILLKTSKLKDVSNIPIDKINYSNLDDDEARYVKNYIDNIHKKEVLVKSNKMEFLGNGFDKAIADNVEDDVISKTLGQIEYSENNVYGQISEALDNDISQSLKDNLNWEDKHVELFKKEILNNKANKGFTYHNRTNQPQDNGLTHRLFTKDDDVFMVMSSKDKEKMIYDMLTRGDDLEDIGKHGSLVRLPKIFDINGVKTVKQGNSVYKAVTNDIISKSLSVNENGLSLMVQDTVESVISDMGKSMRYSKKALERGLVTKATSTLNRAWRNINEEKSLTGSGYIAKEIDGVMNIVKRQSLNRSDYMMRGLINIDKTIGMLPIIFNESTPTMVANNLADEFTNITGGDFGGFIKKLNSRIADGKTLGFDDLTIEQKAWFTKNISSISRLALGNENIKFEGASKSYFEKMQQDGLAGFLLKDTGEVTNGYYNVFSPLDFNPGSRYADVSRPPVNQILNADVINEDSMNIMLKNNGYGKVAERIANGESVFDVLGVKRGASYTTNIDLPLEEFHAKSKEMLSMSVRKKIMNETEFANYGDYLLNDKKSIQKIAKDLSKNNINATEDEILSAVRRIFTTTNMYEDHGLSKISLGMAFGNKSIVSKDIDKNFKHKIGDYITDGTILNIKDGIATKHEGRSVKVVGFDGDRVSLQMFDDYFSFKVGIGVEKAELGVMAFADKREAEILDEVFESVFKADIVHNANIIKHDSWNTVFNQYTNILSDSIDNEADAAYANKILHSKLGEGNLHILKYSDYYKRWMVVEAGYTSVDDNFNTPVKLKSAFDEMRTSGTTFGNRLDKNIIKAEKDRVFMADIVYLKDNTIQNAQSLDNIGKGVSISSKGLSVMGKQLGDISSYEETFKYGTLKDGKFVSNWAPIKRHLEGMIVDNPQNQRLANQAGRIQGVLHYMNGDKGTVNGFNIDKFRKEIQDISIDEVVTPKGMVDADQLSDIFVYREDGPKAFRISIDEKLKIRDFRTQENIAKSIIEESGGRIDSQEALRRASEIIKERGYKKNVTEIIIPALDPNRAGEQVSLSNLQKSYADLFNNIRDITDGNYEGISHKGLITKINEGYENIARGLVFELGDKNGIAKRSTKTKALFSARTKMMKITAPVTKNGQYMDLDFRDISTKRVNGKIEYRQVAFRNIQDIVDANVGEAAYGERLESIGRQLINSEIDNTDEMLDVFNSVLKKNHYGAAKSIEEARNVLKRTKLDRNSFINLAEDFFYKVGFNSIVTRDPTFKDESYQIARTYASKTTSRGTSMLDAVTAKYLNADADGDEIGFINHLFYKGEDGTVAIRTQNHELTQKSNKIMVSMRDDNQKLFDRLVQRKRDEYEMSIKKNVYTLDGYIAHATEKTDDGIIKTISTADSNAYRELSARLSKGEIGKISNTGYYLKGATDSYINSMIGNADIEKTGFYMKTIQTFTSRVEQGIIDVKSMKDSASTSKALGRVTKYGRALDAIAEGSSENAEAKALTFLMDDLDFLIKDGHFEAGGLDLSLEGNAKALNISEAVERVIAGNIIKSSSPGKNATFEEALYVVKEILQSDVGKDAYTHMSVRQSVPTKRLGKEVSLESRMREVVGEDFNNKVNSIFGEDSAISIAYNTDFIDNSVVVKNNFGGDKVINRGEVIYNTTSKPGVYRYKNTKRGLGGAVVELEDLSNRQILTFSGNTFGDVSEQLKTGGFMASIDETIGEFNQTYSELLDDDDFIKLSAKVVETSKEYKEQQIRSSLDEFIKAKNNDFGLNSNEINKNITMDAFNSIEDLAAQEDLLTTARVLENEKYYTKEQSKELIENMNRKIKEKGTKEYRKMKEEALLKNSSFAKKYSLNSSNIGGFIDKNISNDKRKMAYQGANYSHISEKLESMKRIDIDSIINGISDTDSEYMEKLTAKLIDVDSTMANQIFNLTSGHIEELDFQSKVLGWKLDNIDELLKNNKGAVAMDQLGASKIAYGKYVGYSVNNLSDNALTEVLSEQVDGVSDEVKTKMHSIINKVKEMQSRGIERNINTNGLASATNDSFIKSSIEEMNKKIKEKGKKLQNSSDNSILSKGKSLLEKIEDTVKTSNNKSKIKYAAIAGAAALAAGAYLFGGDIKDSKSSSFNKAPDEKSNIKTDQYVDGKRSGSVPMTDSRFYEAQETGLNVNISGRAGRNSSARDTSSQFENMFGGRGVNVNTNISDTRRQINEKEIEDIMFNASF